MSRPKTKVIEISSEERKLLSNFIEFYCWKCSINKTILSRRLKLESYVLGFFCNDHPGTPKYALNSFNLIKERVLKYFQEDSLEINPENYVEKILYYKIKNGLKWNDWAEKMGLDIQIFKNIRHSCFSSYNSEFPKMIEKATKGYIKQEEFPKKQNQISCWTKRRCK